MKLLWDFTIQCDRHIPHNRSDMLYVNYLHKIAYLIDVAIPGDIRVIDKIIEVYRLEY